MLNNSGALDRTALFMIRQDLGTSTMFEKENEQPLFSIIELQ